MIITRRDRFSSVGFGLIIIGIYGAVVMLLVPLVGYAMIIWLVAIAFAGVHLYFCSFSPQSVILHGIISNRIDTHREQIIHSMLVKDLPTLRSLEVYIVDDISVNMTMFRSYSTVYLLITSRFIEKLSGAHAEGALRYMSHIVAGPLFYTHSMVMTFAVLLEKLRITSIIAASIIHSFIPAPQDKVWDSSAVKVHGSDTYCEIFKVIIQCMYKSSAMPSSLSVASFADISHGPLTYESMYSVHVAEMIRKEHILSN